MQKLLPTLPRTHEEYSNRIEQYYGTTGSNLDLEDTEGKFRERLRAYGVNSAMIELLVLKFVDGWSFEEITRSQGWVSKGAVFNQYRETIKFLRKVGFKFE